ncbi:glycosyl transferase family 1 [Pseudomonas sp. YY-1]|uniref:glycosyltransferase n=1 Tax=Pseudomonas sp. YY-1 TaxID=2058659 RepID=UPI000CAA849F|nr:glycosyltransferase [Pseudomonas sp. YY-1]PKQ41253.1 glycosyl transferase family 1 [Pseudomonas sp. YY-1]
MRNAHINMNEFTNASRVLKQVSSLVESNVFESIMIIALGTDALRKHEVLAPRVELYRISLLTRKLPKNLLFQSVKYIEFFFRSIWLLARFKPQVVNAHALLVMPIACAYKLIFKAHLVYDAHELETEQEGGGGLRKSMSKWLERKLIYSHDLMFVVSESIADWYVRVYGIARPLVVLNAPVRRAIKKNNHFRQQLGIRENQIILLYQGVLGAGRGVQLIVEAFKQRFDDRVVAVFMGYGVLQAEVEAAAAQYNNIFFYPAVPSQIVLEYTSSADLGVSLIENTCLSYFYCMPNKLFEYSMAGLPVVVSNMRDMSDLVSKNKMGVVVEDLTAAGINRVVDDLLVQDLASMSDCAYRVACEYAWDVQEQKMLNAYRVMLELRA